MTYPEQGPQPGPQQPPQGYAPQQPFPDQPPTGKQPRQKRVNRGLIITFVVVLVLALGTGGTWLALHLRSSDGGGDDPDEAVENLAAVLDEGDTAGLMETLAPGEGEVFQDLHQEGFEEFERLGMLRDDAQPDILAGIDIHAEDLMFDEPQQVNEHLRIAKLTEGTITIDVDPDAGPLREEYREAISLALMGFTAEFVKELPASPGLPGFPGGMSEVPNLPGVPEVPDIEVPDVEAPDIEVPDVEAPGGFRAGPDEPATDADQSMSNEDPGISPLRPADRQDPSDELDTHETIDIADLVEDTGEPLRIATVESDGTWYPSLLHSVVDEVLRDQGIPWPSEQIPGNGAESPEDALKYLVQAGLDRDFTRLIELLPPDEMGVFHDVGALVTAIEPGGSPESEVTRIETETSEDGAATRVTPTLIEITNPNGETATFTRDDDCYELSLPEESERFCADDVPDLVDDFVAEVLEDDATAEVPDDVEAILTDVGARVLHDDLSVLTTEVDGDHYVSPLRTLGDLGMTPLRNLEQDELEALMDSAEPR